jgi:hypothetical protein
LKQAGSKVLGGDLACAALHCGRRAQLAPTAPIARAPAPVNETPHIRAAFKKQQKLNTKHHLMAQQLSLDKPDTATSPARPSSVGLAGAGGGPLPPRREGEALPAGATEGGDGGVGSAGRGGEGGGGRWFGEKEPAAGARQWTNGGMSQGAPGAASGPAAAAGAELPGAALKSPGVLTAVGGSFSLSGASDRVRPMSAVPWSTANASSPPTKYTKDAVRPTSALR